MKFLKCPNSFTSSYSGSKSAIIKDDLMFFLKHLTKEEELASRKASNLEPVLMVGNAEMRITGKLNLKVFIF